MGSGPRLKFLNNKKRHDISPTNHADAGIYFKTNHTQDFSKNWRRNISPANHTLDFSKSFPNQPASRFHRLAPHFGADGTPPVTLSAGIIGMRNCPLLHMISAWMYIWFVLTYIQPTFLMQPWPCWDTSLSSTLFYSFFFLSPKIIPQPPLNRPCIWTHIN